MVPIPRPQAVLVVLRVPVKLEEAEAAIGIAAATTACGGPSFPSRGTAGKKKKKGAAAV